MCVFRITLILVAALSFFSSGCVHADGYDRLRKMNEISREMAKERNQEIVFFGKVVDFKGNPVADAEVTMRIRVFGARTPKSNFKVIKTQTDENGSYSISSFGEMVTLESLSKEGYEYSYKYNHKRSLNSKKPEKRKGLGYELDKPMVFKIRKKGPSAFLMGGSGGRLGFKPGEHQYWDMYLRKSASETDLIIRNMVNQDWHADIKVYVEKDVSGYKLIFEALDPESGFVKPTYKFEDELKEAPEHGYKPKLVIPIKEGESKKFYAYVKNEGGLFYSRLKISHSHREGTDYVGIDSHYSTNMTGGRGFESSAEFDQEYRRLRKEINAPPLSREHLRDGTIVLPVLEATQ